MEEKSVSFEFVDFKKVGVEKDSIKRWKSFLGDWPVNKRGTTYRKFKEEFVDANDQEKLNIIQENTSMIPRPILERNGKILKIGFDEEFLRTL